jgi:hypothetical protein
LIWDKILLEDNPIVLYNLRRTAAVLRARLNQPSAEELADAILVQIRKDRALDAGRRLVKRSWVSFYLLAENACLLGPRMSADRARDMYSRIAECMEAHLRENVEDEKALDDRDSLSFLRDSLAALAPHLQPRQAEALAGLLARRLAVERGVDSGGYENLAAALQAILARMDGKDAAALANGAARAVLKQLRTHADPPAARIQLLGALAQLAPSLTSGAASASADEVITLTRRSALASELAAYAQTVSRLLRNVDSGETPKLRAAAAAILAQKLQQLLVSDSAYSVGQSLDPILFLLDDKQAALLADAAGRRLAADVNQAPQALPYRARSFRELTARLDRKHAGRLRASVAQVVLQRLLREPDGYNIQLRSLIEALSELTEGLTADEAATVAHHLIERTEKAFDADVPRSSARLLCLLNDRLNAREARSLAAAVEQRMSRAPDGQTFRRLGLLLIPLGRDGESEVRDRLFTTASRAVLDYLGGGRLVAPSDPFLVAYRALLVRLTKEELVGMLKQPSSVGAVRQQILSELGQRYEARSDPRLEQLSAVVGPAPVRILQQRHCAFTNTWEAVEWLRQNDPKLDLAAPPRVPSGLTAARRPGPSS